MKKILNYLKQLLIIVIITVLAYLLNIYAPINMPASIYGIILLFSALCLKIIKYEQIKDVGNYLIFIMPLFLIPGGVGLINIWGEFQSFLIPILIVIVLTTILIMVTTGVATNYFMKRGKK